MNLSQTFIERPIATSLLMGAIALFGTVAYRSLPVSDLPNVDFPTLMVTAQLPGASPDTMASSVATPLENQFSNIAGIEAMTSVNSLGNTQVTLEFDLNRSLDGAAIDVQSAITQASKLLPLGMPTPPTFSKVNPALQPILYVALTSKQVPLWTLDEYAETRIAQRISMISGVAQVQVMGAQKYAVHVRMDPDLLASHKVGINEIQTALQGWNVNLPTGQITGPQRAFTLQASGQLTTADQYKSLVVTYRNDSAIRLQELGDLKDSVEDDKTASWFYTHEDQQRSHRARHSAPARDQHDHRHRLGEDPAADVPVRIAAFGPSGHPLRPLRHHSRIVPGRRVHHAVDLGPGDRGDLPVPAQRFGHHHSQPGAAVLHHRHLRRHVPARSTAWTTCP